MTLYMTHSGPHSAEKHNIGYITLEIHPVPVLGREWVLVLSTERELRLASAEGLGLAWE